MSGGPSEPTPTACTHSVPQSSFVHQGNVRGERTTSWTRSRCRPRWSWLRRSPGLLPQLSVGSPTKYGRHSCADACNTFCTKRTGATPKGDGHDRFSSVRLWPLQCHSSSHTHTPSRAHPGTLRLPTKKECRAADVNVTLAMHAVRASAMRCVPRNELFTGPTARVTANWKYNRRLFGNVGSLTPCTRT